MLNGGTGKSSKAWNLGAAAAADEAVFFEEEAIVVSVKAKRESEGSVWVKEQECSSQGMSARA